jgi:CDP-glycerol glycerophosphotransferase
LHTWHGIPIKKIGNATGKRRDFNFSNVDYFTVSSEYEVPIYINDFRVKSTSIIRTGMPRNEELYDRYDSEYLQKLKLKMNIPTNKKIILFAPTWRDSNDLGKNYDISIPVDFKEWKKKLGSQYVVLFRAHPLTTRLLNFEFDDFILNFSDYSAVNDLLLVSDLVITDYSGIMFDFLATLDNEPERRVILYPYDLDEYKRNRGIYLIYESEFEGLYTRSQDHLLKMVLLEKEYNEAKLKEIREKFLVFGGNATQQCLNYLFKEIINKGELQ